MFKTIKELKKKIEKNRKQKTYKIEKNEK